MTIPPTLSLWPFRYFVVLWMTRSAPSSIGRCTLGLANVLSTTITMSCRRAIAADGGDVGQPQHRVGRRLEEQHPRLRRDRGLDLIELRGVDVAERQPVARQHLVEQPERAAVGVVGDDDVIAGREQLGDRVDRRHARGEGEAGPAALDRREVGFERGARRVLRARVLVALVPAELLLHVGGRLVDRRDDRARRRVRCPGRRGCTRSRSARRLEAA